MWSLSKSSVKVPRVCDAALLLTGAIAAVAFGGSAAANPRSLAPPPFGHGVQTSACRLGPNGEIRHVIIVQFDNVHLERDNPNVPWDIEQIPALYDFMTDDGTLLANDHTVLISHTSDGILSTETGLYPDSFGGGVGNTFPYLDPEQTGTRNSASAAEVDGTNATSLFTYWTDPTSSDDPDYTLLTGAASSSNPDGVNTPAPWVAFTRAGCDFAGVASADMELENDTSDLSNLYGATSAQAGFGNWSYNTAYGQ